MVSISLPMAFSASSSVIIVFRGRFGAGAIAMPAMIMYGIDSARDDAFVSTVTYIARYDIRVTHDTGARRIAYFAAMVIFLPILQPPDGHLINHP